MEGRIDKKMIKKCPKLNTETKTARIEAMAQNKQQQMPQRDVLADVSIMGSDSRAVQGGGRRGNRGAGENAMF